MNPPTCIALSGKYIDRLRDVTGPDMRDSTDSAACGSESGAAPSAPARRASGVAAMISARTSRLHRHVRRGWLGRIALFGFRSVTVWCVLLLPGAGLAQDHDLARQIAGASAKIERQTAEGEKVLAQLRARLRELHEASGELDASMSRIERRAAVYALGGEFARTLTEQLRRLPRPQALADGRAADEQLLAGISDANLGVERELMALRNLDAATSALLARESAHFPAAQLPQIETATHAGLIAKRDLLQQIDTLQNEILDALHEVGESERAYAQQVENARAQLTGFLFWIPVPMGMHTVGELIPAIEWTLSPSNWRTAAANLVEGLARDPVWPTLALLASALLMALRGRLRAVLVSLAPAAARVPHDRISDTLRAVAASLALALPAPLLLWTAGQVLAFTPESEPFTLALSGSLLSIARLWLALSALVWLLERHGVAASHFGWDKVALDNVVRSLRRFAKFFVPLMFVAALNGLDHAPFANRESLGRLCFGLAMLAFAALLWRLFRYPGPVMQRVLKHAPRGRTVRLHGLWFWPLVVSPLVSAAFAGAGYFVAASYFFSSLVTTLFLALGAVLLYGLIGLWLRRQRARLGQRQAEAGAAQQDCAEETGSEAVAPPPQRLDFGNLAEQTRSLLNLLIMLLLFAGIWWVWRDALPALSAIGHATLWNSTSLAGGKTVTHDVTVDRLLLAVLVTFVTVVALRKAGALLDIALLRRLEMQADATYAIKVITRYVLLAAGIVLAFGLLGVGWNDLQWLIAALGVGLGFGLQEIVANFVSGLIVLAERPVRIGDVVTVGSDTGTVWRIRARATTVVDFENKEVIIPNKAFITERVVNWTLSDQITRLLLPVGVAYGSDVAQVQQWILEALAAHPDVLRKPPPSVLFVAFGDSALQFEIRAFVDSFGKRLRVQHEINVAVERVLRENGVEIPFPQRDLHIRSGSWAPTADGAAAPASS